MSLPEGFALPRLPELSRWHAAFRFRASRGTPSTAVRSGNLLEFPRLRSLTAVPWSVPAFLLQMPGGTPPLRRTSARDRMPPLRVCGSLGGVRDARNNERHVCARRRVGEPAGSSPAPPAKVALTLSAALPVSDLG